MPPLPSCPVNDDVNIPCQRVDINEEIKVLDIFDDKELLKLAIGRQCMEQGKQYKTTKSSKGRFEVVCLVKNCSWMVRARGIQSTTAFQVTKVVDQHTCCATNLESNHRKSKKKVLDHFIVEVLAEDYNRVYRGNEIVRDINSKFPINISYQQAWRAKQYALLMLRGIKEDSFTKLPAYLHNLVKHNSGNVTQIRTNDDDWFEFVDIALGCSVSSDHFL